MAYAFILAGLYFILSMAHVSACAFLYFGYTLITADSYLSYQLILS
ncbi:hypothetical protein [Pontibacter chinhatensis]|nr:hypothetical protein [Pontibacter chinhatensis]